MEKTKDITGNMMIMPINSGNAGHSVIEVNQCCNIKCKGCYKDKTSYQKPLQQIKREIDYLLKIRKVKVISLSGGEPTLHPQLPEVVEYIKSKGVKAAIISNGLTLMDEGLLKRIKKSGTDFIMLHVDVKQKRKDLPKNPSFEDVALLINKLSDKIKKEGMSAQLSCTLYKSSFDDFEKIINFYLNNSNLDFFAGFNYSANFNWKDIKEHQKVGWKTFNKKKTRLLFTKDFKEQVWNKEVYAKMKGLNLFPHWYIPSNVSPRDLKWLYYSVFVLYRKNKSNRSISYKHNWISKRLMRKMYAVYLKLWACFPVMNRFDKKSESYKFFIYHLLIDILSINFKGFLTKMIFLVQGLLPQNRLIVKPLVFQEPLRINNKGQLVYCRSCPDATIRNGKLVQICLADVFTPLITDTSKINYKGKKGKLYDLTSKRYVE